MNSEEIKKQLILSVISFLQMEANSSDPDKKESIEVAVQCLESAYALEASAKAKFNDLLSIFTSSFSKDDGEKAEEHKRKGNDFMRAEFYPQAVEQYTLAIGINPQNAVYYCNRAAAYSRLGQYHQAVSDCHAAVDIDPSYAKAYGRLGIAYSSLHKNILARDAYTKALSLEPDNGLYEANLRMAENRIDASMDHYRTIGIQIDGTLNRPNQPNPPETSLDISQFLNNPNLLNMASQMLSVPEVRDVMNGIFEGGTQGPGDNPSATVLMQMGQQLAQQLNANDPEFVDSLRREFLEREVPGLAQPASKLGASKKDDPKPPGPDGDAPT